MMTIRGGERKDGMGKESSIYYIKREKKNLECSLSKTRAVTDCNGFRL